MKLKSLVLLALLTIIASCNTNDENSLTPQDGASKTFAKGKGNQQKEQRMLAELLQEITDMANSVTCTDASQWAFTPVGAKACGGPTHYLAYSLTIDVDYFLYLVETYKQEQQAYNIKWGITSDCMMVMPPSSVSCNNGDAVLNYNNTVSF